MNLRLALYDLARTHRLSAPQSRALFALAGFDAPPPHASDWFWRVVTLLAAGLGGFGLVMWVAANWDAIGRVGQFALLQGWVLVTALATWRVTGLRTPMGLLCLLGTGALFAYYGQTYQTGADAWQLFALWALLSLPLCLAVRSDVLWCPWVMVACTAISLWTFTHTDHRWRAERVDLSVHLLAWALGALLVIALAPWARRWTGTTSWSQRLALLATVASITMAAVVSLFMEASAPHFVLGLVMLASAAAALLPSRWLDMVALSAVVLCLDILLVAGWAHLLFDLDSSDQIGRLLLIGLGAAGILAGSVVLIMHRQKAALAAATVSRGLPHE